MTLDKIKGCLVGGLFGDCLGFQFEGHTFLRDNHFSPTAFQAVIDSFSKGFSDSNYTDDTAMTLDILDCLHESNGFNPKNMAKQFCQTYFQDKNKGYGIHVRDIFHSWKYGDFKDVYKPAQKQFNGKGSFGNGGAMRIAPVALYCYNDTEGMTKMARFTTELTHTHPVGILGAFIQCCAVRLALDETQSTVFDQKLFIDNIIKKISSFEKREEFASVFIKQLASLKDYVAKDEVVVEDIIKQFGNGVPADESVTTALYCFLRGMRPVDFLPTENAFERAVLLAFAMGRDTDTIGCMTGAISGAFYGFSCIPVHLITKREIMDKFIIHSELIYGYISNGGLPIFLIEREGRLGISFKTLKDKFFKL